MDERMIRMDQSAFKNYMLSSEAQYLSILEKYDTQHPRGLTEYFKEFMKVDITFYKACLLYTSPSPRDQRGSRMPSSA